MGIIDDYKSVKNRELLLNAATKMIRDKYNIVLNEGVLPKLISNIIGVIGNDIALINTSLKLPELNNLTLIKIKEYIAKQVVNKSETELQPIIEETQGNEKLEDDDDLIMKLQELENKRRMSSTFMNEMSIAGTGNAEGVEGGVAGGVAGGVVGGVVGGVAGGAVGGAEEHSKTVKDPILQIPEQFYKSMAKRQSVPKKVFIINSHNRDWIKQPQRNMLYFKIGIDCRMNVVEPEKILFPVFVKNITPYVNLTITDDARTQKYIYFFNKTNGDWDEWVHIQQDNPLYLSNGNWKITLHDCFNSPLLLGSDDINVMEVSLAENGKDFIIKVDLENEEHHLDMLKKNDIIYVKTYNGAVETAKVLHNSVGSLTIRNSTLKQEDFIQSKILNWKAQYYIAFSYHAKELND
jgi:hypothetical protein